MTDYKHIKQLVEQYSNIPDISLKSRGRFIKDCRYVYFELCMLYVELYTTSKCGQEVNLNHATVLHGLKNFKLFYGSKDFAANEVFDMCNGKLKEEYIFSINKPLEYKIEKIDELIHYYNDMKMELKRELETN